MIRPDSAQKRLPHMASSHENVVIMIMQYENCRKSGPTREQVLVRM